MSSVSHVEGGIKIMTFGMAKYIGVKHWIQAKATMPIIMTIYDLEAYMETVTTIGKWGQVMRVWLLILRGGIYLTIPQHENLQDQKSWMIMPMKEQIQRGLRQAAEKMSIRRCRGGVGGGGCLGLVRNIWEVNEEQFVRFCSRLSWCSWD